MSSRLLVPIFFFFLSTGASSAFAAEEIKVNLPDATGEIAGPINDSRASINAFSCAEIAKGWKADADVENFLKIGQRRGLRLLEWMEKSPQDKLIKVGMNLAGFWNLNSQGKAVSKDFYLGRVSSDVSSFLNSKYLDSKLPQYPPKNTIEYLKNAESKLKKVREELFNEYQCSKLK